MEFHNDELLDALKSLDDRSKDIILRRYLTDTKVTLHELADEYQVSAERIRQIENGALKNLRVLCQADCDRPTVADSTKRSSLTLKSSSLYDLVDKLESNQCKICS